MVPVDGKRQGTSTERKKRRRMRVDQFVGGSQRAGKKSGFWIRVVFDNLRDHKLLAISGLAP